MDIVSLSGLLAAARQRIQRQLQLESLNKSGRDACAPGARASRPLNPM